MTVPGLPQCLTCKHFDDSGLAPACSAFPIPENPDTREHLGIPFLILFGDPDKPTEPPFDHRDPWPFGDNGVRWEPKEAGVEHPFGPRRKSRASFGDLLTKGNSLGPMGATGTDVGTTFDFGWDEDRHPRDAYGRFAGSGSGRGGEADADAPPRFVSSGRDPVPRLGELEPPPISAPMSKEDAAARKKYIEQAIDAHVYEKGDTMDMHDRIGGKVGAFTPERAALHAHLLDEAMTKFEDVPNDRRAVLLGGLGGAGKTSVLSKNAAEDLGLEFGHGEITNFATVNPDDFKVALAKAGAVPVLPGLAPMEAASLMHEESSVLSARLAERLMSEGKNINFDKTMSKAASARGVLDSLQEHGYETRMAFVSVTTEKSVERVTARWERGVDRWLKNPDSELGGRFVPPAVVRAQADPSGEYRSKNERNFEELRNHPAVSWSGRFDNMGSAADQIIANEA